MKGKSLLADPPVNWRVSVPTSLALELELLLADPLTLKTQYGARSRLIVSLLKGWVLERRKS